LDQLLAKRIDADQWLSAYPTSLRDADGKAYDGANKYAKQDDCHDENQTTLPQARRQI
jgi:hypothetical protein